MDVKLAIKAINCCQKIVPRTKKTYINRITTSEKKGILTLFHDPEHILAALKEHAQSKSSLCSFMDAYKEVMEKMHETEMMQMVVTLLDTIPNEYLRAFMKDPNNFTKTDKL